MTISFDSDRHDELVAALTRASELIRAELDVLEAQATALRDSWSGEARRAYDLAHREWSQAMAGLNIALDAGTKSADAAGVRLARAEQSAASTWA